MALALACGEPAGAEEAVQGGLGPKASKIDTNTQQIVALVPRAARRLQPSTFNLQHSHVWLSFGALDRWLISPATHQVHHSVDPAHHNRNFDNLLAIWDRLAGTLKLPREVAGDEREPTTAPITPLDAHSSASSAGSTI